VESKVVVGDGDTIVLGGIMKTSTTKNMQGVPWLNKIPVLGWLFKSTSDTTEERELLIFVTPRVIRDTAAL
jgi:type IV pilus assembly protein PilQ